MRSPFLLCARRAAHIFALIGLTALSSLSTSAGIGDLDEHGWTAFMPSADSRIIYVSASSGNDGTGRPYSPIEVVDPFLPGSVAAYQTVAAGMAQLRDGYPDWILFQRGDSWYESLGSFRLSGRSGAEPMLLSAYGAEALPRPTFKVGDGSLLSAFTGVSPAGNDFSHHVAFVSLHGYAHVRNPDDPEYTNSQSTGNFGINWVRRSDDLLFEDLQLDFFSTGVVMQANWAGGEIVIHNVALRRNIVTDSYRLGTHTQGIFIDASENFLIEGNVVDYNGWREGVDNTLVERLKGHDIYIQFDNTPGSFVVRDNILTRGSLHGLQLRAGGRIEGNYFARNAMHSYNRGDFFPSITNDNVYQENEDVVAFDGSTPRGAALDVYDLNPAYQHEVRGNIISQDLSGIYNSYAIRTWDESAAAIGEEEWDYHLYWPSYSYNLLIEDNVVYNHRGGVHLLSETSAGIQVRNNQIQDPLYSVPVVQESYHSGHSDITFENNTYYSGAPANEMFSVDGVKVDFATWAAVWGDTGSVVQQLAYPDPDRTAATYAASLGYANSFDGYIEQARLQRKGYWREAFTARGINDYIRAGFGQGGSDFINFNEHVVTSYDDQDLDGTFQILGGGTEIELYGNTWKKIGFPYTVTPDTVVEFEVKISTQGEVQGISLDEDNDFNDQTNGVFNRRVFDLYGTQALPAAIDESESGVSYTGSGAYQSIVLPVGLFYTGQMNYLGLVNDHDAAPADAQINIRNLKVYESPTIIPVTGVSLEQSTLQLEPGETAQLVATVSPIDATDPSLTWESSNPSVATVSASGLVTAVADGTSTILVTTTDGGFMDISDVTVTVPLVTTIETFASHNLTESYTSGSFVGDGGVTWSYTASLNKAYRTVNVGDSNQITLQGSVGTLSATFGAGISEITFKMRSWQAAVSAVVNVEVNGVLVGTFNCIETQSFTISGLTPGANDVVEFFSVAAGTRNNLDDISITGP